MRVGGFVFGCFFSGVAAAKGVPVFDLSDFDQKVAAGYSAKDYCGEKAAEVVRQAAAQGAPKRAQDQLRSIIGVACSLDIVEQLGGDG